MAIVLCVLSLLCLGGGLVIAHRHRRTPADRRQPDNVPIAVVLFALSLTILALAAQIHLQPGGALKDLVATAGAVGGVVITVFGMWLGHRRYRIEDARQYLEMVRTDLEHRKG